MARIVSVECAILNTTTTLSFFLSSRKAFIETIFLNEFDSVRNNRSPDSRAPENLNFLKMAQRNIRPLLIRTDSEAPAEPMKKTTMEEGIYFLWI